MVVSLVSFGFKYGIPYGTDLLFDVRFLPTRTSCPSCATRPASTPVVRSTSSGSRTSTSWSSGSTDLLLFLLPRYRQENRSYLSMAVGCTGGRHRSVAICERLARSCDEAGWPARVDPPRHRALERVRRRQLGRVIGRLMRHRRTGR